MTLKQPLCRVPESPGSALPAAPCSVSDLCQHAGCPVTRETTRAVGSRLCVWQQWRWGSGRLLHLPLCVRKEQSFSEAPQLAPGRAPWLELDRGATPGVVRSEEVRTAGGLGKVKQSTAA